MDYSLSKVNGLNFVYKYVLILILMDYSLRIGFSGEDAIGALMS